MSDAPSVENDVPSHESWAAKHVREKPGHRAKEGLYDPGSCDDCRERSPIYDLGKTRVLPPGGSDA